MRRIFAITFALVLTGCATQANYEKILQSWVGTAEQDLIDKWGPPSRVYVASERKYLTYDEASTMILPGQAPSYTTTMIGNTAYTTAVGGYDPTMIDLSCSTTFVIAKGVIQSWSIRGNHCVATE